jgi:hypothetical protein
MQSLNPLSRRFPDQFDSLSIGRSESGLVLLRDQILPHGKHLGADVGSEAIHLLAVLLHLLSVEHALEAAGLLGKLEQPLPFVLGQQGLLGECPLGVLGLSLRLPLSDLGLFATKLALIELEVVEIRVVRLDALEEKIAGLL